jgi:hypothetical protein
MLALVPPVGVAFATNSLEFLVGITGSYAGAGIQVKTTTKLGHVMIKNFSMVTIKVI